MPLNKILLEADGPFTKTNKGKSFEPIDTLIFTRELSNLKKIDEQNMKEAIIKNFKTLTYFNTQ